MGRWRCRRTGMDEREGFAVSDFCKAARCWLVLERSWPRRRGNTRSSEKDGRVIPHQSSFQQRIQRKTECSKNSVLPYSAPATSVLPEPGYHRDASECQPPRLPGTPAPKAHDVYKADGNKDDEGRKGRKMQSPAPSSRQGGDEGRFPALQLLRIDGAFPLGFLLLLLPLSLLDDGVGEDDDMLSFLSRAGPAWSARVRGSRYIPSRQ